MLQIIINDKQYRTFIEYAMATCDSFSIVFEKDDSDKLCYIFQDVYSSLSEFVLEQKNIGEHPDTGSSFQNADIYYFGSNQDTKAVLKTANSVLDWNGENLPEELCFYRNGKKRFVCVWHEKYLFSHNETKEDIMFLNKEGINYWLEI